ncbi:MAG: Fe(3+) dicitrate transport protein [Porticoccus sp.]|jgi:Fe(3+) dicitrate transport protein|uniref:TonB-dependent receptor family protein n=1 Tax=Porticoccus sp. TaxID=2024853 RepID=UPI0039E60173
MANKLSLSIFTASLTLSMLAMAVDETRTDIETISIIGSREDVQELAGSGALIDQEQIAIEASTDINQLLKTVPGIYIREEDGFGLRPNIGIRGATSERSSKITLLEDGIMIAPAPYAGPAAYYFPTTMRMDSIEVLKGAPLLRYGPQTTGGIVNLRSTPIPEENSGKLRLAAGEDGMRDLHLNYGGRFGGGELGNFGWLLETVQRDADGFKKIDRSGRDTGYDIEDYMGKLLWEIEGQSLLLKAQYSEEISDETYLGLTDADFRDNPKRRYGLSLPDEMSLRHKGYSAIYNLDLTDSVRMTATGYYNEFSRNWFKLSGGGSLINAANGGDANAQAILDGTADTTGLTYKNNDREYESYGLELNFAVDMGVHQLNIGGRAHEDEVDRLQPVDVYDQVDGKLVYVSTNPISSGDNRVEDAEAISFWLTDNWQVTDALALNLFLRYEKVHSSEERYTDESRNTISSKKSNRSEELLPGVSFTYDLNDQWQVLAGVHRGFSPLGGGASEREDPETSINYEAGVRFNENSFFAEMIGFYSDFDNKTENCSVANPCSNGDTSGSFTTGEAVIQGIELTAGNRFQAGDFTIPVDLAYTYTKAEISEDEGALGFEKGDRLADIPKNTFSLRAGLETPMGWNNYMVAKYTDRLCSNIGCDNGSRLGRTDSLFVVDLISRYSVNPDTVVYAKVDNVFDRDEIVSRLPDGARPNKPRTASVGIEYAF